MASFIVHPKTGELIPKEDYYIERYYEKEHLQMTDGNQVVTMNFISDNMEPTRHMADGKYYTSKKAFRNATKAAGCVEIGNETSTVLKPRKRIELDKRERREHIRKAIYDVKNGNYQRSR